MWRITIIINALLMGVFWVASLISVALVYNRFMEYPPSEVPVELPSPTVFALSTQLWAGLIPLAWAVLSFLIWHKVKDLDPGVRSEYLLLFTTITLAVGCVMLVFFVFAATVPFMFIKTIVK